MEPVLWNQTADVWPTLKGNWVAAKLKPDAGSNVTFTELRLRVVE